MDLNQLQYFIDIASTKNFTEAANKNHLSQPAISNNIAALERELQVKLFHRDTHSVSLTECGKVFLPYAKEILMLADVATAKMNSVSYYENNLMLLLPDSIHKIIAPCIAMFLDRYPKAYLTVRHSLDLYTLINNEHDPADICFGYAFSSDLKHSKYYFKLLQKDKMVLAYNKNWFPNGKINLDMFQDFPFLNINLLKNKDLADMAAKICETYNFSPKTREYCDTEITLTQSVAAGLGYCIAPYSFFNSCDLNNIDFYDFSGNAMDVYIVYAYAKKNNNPAVMQFLNFLNGFII